MEIGKKKASVIGIVALALMISVTLGLFMQRSGLTPAYLVFAVDSNPDSHGNRIESLKVYQNKTGSFDWVATIDTGNYTSDMTVEIDANYPTFFAVAVRINNTLASSTDDAKSKTRVYLNISEGVYTNEDLTAVSSDPGGDWYYVVYQCDPWTPTTDTLYNCAVRYEAYY